jgi:hypothetical protein
MSENPAPLPDYETPKSATTRPGPIRRGLAVIGTAIVAFVVMFIPTFFGGASGFEEESVAWWSWPAVLVTAAICFAIALSMRKSKPMVFAGTVIGVALGLLWAGLCFTGA